MIRQKNKKITLAQQQFALQAKYNDSITTLEIKKSVLRCNVMVKPTAQSREYKLSIEYKINGVPKAYLINQGLLKSVNDKPPHLYECKYSGDGKERLRLCLFLPGTNEWNRNMMVADTFIPWAVEWLYYYEVWRMTGKWLGGGHDGEKN